MIGKQYFMCVPAVIIEGYISIENSYNPHINKRSHTKKKKKKRTKNRIINPTTTRVQCVVFSLR